MMRNKNMTQIKWLFLDVDAKQCYAIFEYEEFIDKKLLIPAKRYYDFDHFAGYHQLNPDETIFFVDRFNLDNLKKAKDLGMLTIYLSQCDTNKPDFCDYMFKDIGSALKQLKDIVTSIGKCL